MSNKVGAKPATVEFLGDKEFQRTVDAHARAGFPGLVVVTTEEKRALRELRQLADARNVKLVQWTATEGFTGGFALDMKQPIDALTAIGSGKLPDNSIVVLCDFDDFYNVPGGPGAIVRRQMRTLLPALETQRNKPTVIVLTASDIIPDKLRGLLTVIEMPLPKEEQLTYTVNQIERSLPEEARIQDDELRYDMVQSLFGLTEGEAKNCCALGAVMHNGLKPASIGTIKDEKATIIKRGEVLTYIPEQATASRSQIGGFDLYLDWLDRRKQAYSREAAAVGLDFPRGVSLLGIPGTGKSYVAKATGQLLGLPLYIMDVGAVFNHLVGASEQRLRNALRQVEAQNGAVLLMDEADKAFNSALNANDGGVSARVLGGVLTWLAEHKSRVFTIMTLNRIEGLPPELFRAGRFDSVFYTDLPTSKEREDILRIHLAKRNVQMDQLKLADGDLKHIIEKLQDYTGAEIEEVVKDARYRAFDARKDGIPNFNELLQAVSTVEPVIRRSRHEIEEMRKFCSAVAKPVSSPEDSETNDTRHIQLS